MGFHSIAKRMDFIKKLFTIYWVWFGELCCNLCVSVYCRLKQASGLRNNKQAVVNMIAHRSRIIRSLFGRHSSLLPQRLCVDTARTPHKNTCIKARTALFIPRSISYFWCAIMSWWSLLERINVGKNWHLIKMTIHNNYVSGISPIPTLPHSPGQLF